MAARLEGSAMSISVATQRELVAPAKAAGWVAPERGDRRARRFGWLLVLPACLFVIALNVFPSLFTVVASLFRWNLAQARIPPRFIGLGNYEELLLRDAQFPQALLNTLLFIVGTVALQTVIGICIALLLNQNLRGTRVATALVLIPMTIAPAVVAWLFSVLLNESLGPVSHLLGILGIASPPWLSDQRWALPTIILVDAWQWTPFIAIISLAGLRSQPASVFEAAVLDGAGPWQRFRHITLPLLRPVLIVAVLLRTIDAFKMFDLVFLLTAGGPGTSSQTLSLYGYRLGVVFFDVGRGSAVSTVMLAIALAFAVLFYRAARTRR
jgi:multiple sugar transport system permease protein